MAHLATFAAGATYGALRAAMILLFYGVSRHTALSSDTADRRPHRNFGVWLVLLVGVGMVALATAVSAIEFSYTAGDLALAVGSWLTATVAGFASAARMLRRDGYAARYREWSGIGNPW